MWSKNIPIFISCCTFLLCIQIRLITMNSYSRIEDLHVLVQCITDELKESYSKINLDANNSDTLFDLKQFGNLCIHKFEFIGDSVSYQAKIEQKKKLLDNEQQNKDEHKTNSRENNSKFVMKRGRTKQRAFSKSPSRSQSGSRSRSRSRSGSESRPPPVNTIKKTKLTRGITVKRVPLANKSSMCDMHNASRLPNKPNEKNKITTVENSSIDTQNETCKQ